MLVGLWLLAARPLAQLIDRVSTAPIAVQAPTLIGWNGVFLQFAPPRGGTMGAKTAGVGADQPTLDLQGPGPAYPQVAGLTVDGDNRLVLSAHGRSFVLGSRAGDLAGGGDPMPAFAAEPGDVGALSIERSWLSWPVFETNFISGQSPTWRRDLYYRLSWRKRSGARLDMLWRFEQGFYPADGWTAPESRDGVTGLVRVEIQSLPVGR